VPASGAVGTRRDELTRPAPALSCRPLCPMTSMP